VIFDLGFRTTNVRYWPIREAWEAIYSVSYWDIVGLASGFFDCIPE